MIFSNILLIILHAQLLLPVLGEDLVTVEIVNKAIEFDEDLEVTFRYEGNDIQPSLGDYIGIYKKGQIDDDTIEETYLYTCNSNDYEENCKYLDAPAEGTLTFSVRDPYGDSGGYDRWWPLNPGNYQACLYNEAADGTYNLISDCEEFKVKGIKVKKLKKVTVLKKGPRKFKLGAPITLKIENKQVEAPGQWISLQPAKGFDSTGGLTSYSGSSDHWLYFGCNNQFGDQDSGLCGKSVSVGDVEISQLSQEYWAVPVGKYKVCLVFSHNVNDDDKYPLFKCAEKLITIEK